MNEKVVFHTGDIGDIIASLASCKALGSCKYKIGFRENGQRETMHGERFESIKPLLEAQYYINSVEWDYQIAGITHDFSTFRSHYQVHENLALQQAKHVGITVNIKEPWLKVEPIYHNRTVIARSSRYHNPIFPWRRLLDSLEDEPLFVGLVTEHKAFESYFGEIEYQKTENILELAKVIAGAKQLISNQTCAWCLGASLGLPTIQETFLSDMNSVIDRPNLKYSRSIEEVNRLIDSL